MREIETNRLRMRLFKPEDLDDYHAQIYSDPDVTRYLPGGKPRPKDKTQAVLEYFVDHNQQHGFTVWAVFDKPDNRFVGHCGLLYLEGTPDVELAYAFGKAFWGMGIASEAARASLRYGFETVGLARILALAFPDNRASQRVMQKIGMQHRGMTDRYHNAQLVLYALEREAYRPDNSVYIVHS
jgi:ribosomal-protein-alanine N-acetyltransferase